jgi:hypothetical protein
MADAAAYSGVADRSKLINFALDAYVKRMAAKRLVALGGTMPHLEVPDCQGVGHPGDDSPSREAARALAALGGTMSDLEVPERRRSSQDPASKVADDDGDYGEDPGSAEKS